MCHEPFVIQKASDLVQEVETGGWHDSDPIREQNRPLDWLELFYFIPKTKLSQVFIPSLTARTKIYPAFDEAAAHLRTDSKKYRGTSACEHNFNSCILLVLLVV